MELSVFCVPGFEMLIALARQRLPPAGFSYLLHKTVLQALVLCVSTSASLEGCVFATVSSLYMDREHWGECISIWVFMILERDCSVVESFTLVLCFHCRFINWSQMYGRV